MRYPRFATFATLLGVALLPLIAAAQSAAPASLAPRTLVPSVSQDGPARVASQDGAATLEAGDTMRALWQALSQYPPSVAEVLALDPSLLSSAAYLDSYPALAAFLAAHPEVTRNPGFFFPPRRQNGGGSDALAIVAISSGALGMMLLFITLVRTALQHRRWQQGLRVQQEMQVKLTERLLAREDLAAYLDTAAGRRLFESVQIDTDPKSPATPIGRILRSVHTGVVLTFLGISFFMFQGRLSPALGSQVSAAGTVAVMVGLGFLASAGATHLLSRRFGLLPPLETRD